MSIPFVFPDGEETLIDLTISEIRSLIRTHKDLECYVDVIYSKHDSICFRMPKSYILNTFTGMDGDIVTQSMFHPDDGRLYIG